MAHIVGYRIEWPKPKPLTHNPVIDLERIINESYSSLTVFHDDDLHRITMMILRYKDYLIVNTENWRERAAFQKLTFFIRILEYGINFKFVVMLKLSDGTIHNIYNE